MVMRQTEDRVAQTGDLDPEDLHNLQLLAELESAPEPSFKDEKLQGQDVAFQGQHGVPTGVRTAAKSAGYVWLRRQTDGELRQVSRNQYLTYMKMKLPDGKRAWLAPTAEWKGVRKRGDHKCLLNPDHPEYVTISRFNFQPCPKANLLNEQAVRRHMEHKHQSAFDDIEQARLEAREDRRDRHEAAMSEALVKALNTGENPSTRETVGGKKRAN